MISTVAGSPSTNSSAGGPTGYQRLVVGDVLPPVAEVLAGERLAVRPLVPLAQMQGEDPAVLDLDVLQDVRHQLEILVVADQPRIAVDHHQAGVPAAARPACAACRRACRWSCRQPRSRRPSAPRAARPRPAATPASARRQGGLRRGCMLCGVVDGLNIGFCTHTHGVVAAEIGQMGGSVAQGERRRPRGRLR